MNVFTAMAYHAGSAIYRAAAKSVVMMKLEAVGLRGGKTDAFRRALRWNGAPRRVGAAPSLSGTDLIMFDEPFVGEDPITMGVAVKLISGEQRAGRDLRGGLALMCQKVRQYCGSRTRIWRTKKIVAHGSAQALQENTDRAYVSSLTVLPTGRFRSAIRRATIAADLLETGS